MLRSRRPLTLIKQVTTDPPRIDFHQEFTELWIWLRSAMASEGRDPFYKRHTQDHLVAAYNYYSRELIDFVYDINLPSNAT